jgi:hypothetical protein
MILKIITLVLIMEICNKERGLYLKLEVKKKRNTQLYKIKKINLEADNLTSKIT